MTDVNAAAEPQQERSARHAFEAACTKIERAGGSVRNQRAVLDVVEDTSPPVYRALSFDFEDAKVFVSLFVPDFAWQDTELHAFFDVDNDDVHSLEAPCPETADAVLKVAYNLAVRKHALLKKRAQAATEPRSVVVYDNVMDLMKHIVEHLKHLPGGKYRIGNSGCEVVPFQDGGVFGVRLLQVHWALHATTTNKLFLMDLVGPSLVAQYQGSLDVNNVLAWVVETYKKHKQRAEAAAEPSALGRLTFNFGRRDQRSADAFYNDAKRIGYQVRQKNVGTPWVNVFIPDSAAVFASVLKLAAPYKPELLTGTSSFHVDEYTSRERLPRVWLAFKNTFNEHRGEFTSAATEPTPEDTGSSAPLVLALHDQLRKTGALRMKSPVQPWKDLSVYEQGGFICLHFTGGVHRKDKANFALPADHFSLGLEEHSPRGSRKHFFDSMYRRTTPGDVHSLTIPKTVTTPEQLLKFLVRTCVDIVRQHQPDFERLDLVVESASEPEPAPTVLTTSDISFDRVLSGVRVRVDSYRCEWNVFLGKGNSLRRYVVCARTVEGLQYVIKQVDSPWSHSTLNAANLHVPDDLLRAVVRFCLDDFRKYLTSRGVAYKRVRSAAEPQALTWTWSRLDEFFSTQKPMYGSKNMMSFGSSNKFYVGTPWRAEHVVSGRIVIGTRPEPGAGPELGFRTYRNPKRGGMLAVAFARGGSSARKQELTSIPQSVLDKATSLAEALRVLLAYPARGKPLISYLKEDE